ncbi:MAG: beta-ketoacyl-[acyl-carrier-protein] synthase family protein, partial [Pricia sp.]|nr:beta-ketoacyl-[acyl-carrier-protein] synthase family protein [Pricia sp.]
MGRRVVVTGLGICAPNGVGLGDFTEAMITGKSGIRFDSRLQELEFGCQIAGEPVVTDKLLNTYFTPLQL